MDRTTRERELNSPTTTEVNVPSAGTRILPLTSVATVIAMSTPKEYLAYYKRVKGIA